MTIRAVLMWYFGALVVIGGSGAAGYTAIKQHRALLAAQGAEPVTTQVAEASTSQVAESPTSQVAEPATSQVAEAATTQVAERPTTQVAERSTRKVAEPPALPPATSVAAQAADATAASNLSSLPPGLTWVAAAPLARSWPSRPKPLIAHDTSRKRVSHPVVAEAHRRFVRPNPTYRPGVYAATRVATAPRVVYYGYPGYYPYRPAYYSYYSQYPYYSAY